MPHDMFTTDVCVISATQDGQITHVNNSFYSLFGYTAQDISSLTLRQLLPPDDVTTFDDALNTILFNQQPEQLHVSVIHQTGKSVTTDWLIIPIQHGTEQLLTCCIQRNEQNPIQDRQSFLNHDVAAKYQALFEQSNDAIFMLSLDNRYLDLNQRAADLLGYDRETMLSFTTEHIVNPKQQSHMFNTGARLLNGEIIAPYEREFIHANGSIIPVEINVELVRDEHNQPLYIQSIARDISERKAYEKRLRENEKRYRSMFQDNRAVKLLINPYTGQIIEVNQAAIDFYGYSFEQFRTLTIQTINVLSEDEVKTEMHAAVFGEQRFFQFQHRLASGEIRDVDVFSGPIMFGDVTYLYSIVFDVTELRKAREAKLQLRIEQERRKLVEEFIKDATHEFRTPLSIINTNMYLIDKNNAPEKLPKRIAQVTEQIQAMTRLVDMLTMTVRIDSISALNLCEGNLTFVIETVLQNLEPKYAAQNIIIVKEYPPQTMIILQEDDLFLALYEVLDNAFRFAPMNGTITIQVKEHPTKITLTIHNNGEPIANDDLPHIFDKLYRADEAHTTRGFGLGLSIAKRIIELHHGSMVIENTPLEQGGVTTTIELLKPTTT